MEPGSRFRCRYGEKTSFGLGVGIIEESLEVGVDGGLVPVLLHLGCITVGGIRLCLACPHSFGFIDGGVDVRSGKESFDQRVG